MGGCEETKEGRGCCGGELRDRIGPRDGNRGLTSLINVRMRVWWWGGAVGAEVVQESVACGDICTQEGAFQFQTFA